MVKNGYGLSGLKVSDLYPEGWEPRFDVEEYFPHTPDLPVLLKLDAPPRPVGPTEQQTGPNDISDFTARFDSENGFDTHALTAAIWTKELQPEHALPIYYCMDFDGSTSYLSSSGEPSTAKALIAAWSLRSGDRKPERIVSAVDKINKRLASFPDSFVPARVPDLKEVEQKRAFAAGIESLGPKGVFVNFRPVDFRDFYDGRGVWDLLHSMGFLWGDCDAYNWHDANERNDSLISAEGRDGGFYYTAPSDLQSGERNYDSFGFWMEPMRTIEAPHVVRQMKRAVDFFFERMRGRPMQIMMDEVECSDFDQVIAAVDTMAEELRKRGTHTGATAVLQLDCHGL